MKTRATVPPTQTQAASTWIALNTRSTAGLGEAGKLEGDDVRHLA